MTQNKKETALALTMVGSVILAIMSVAVYRETFISPAKLILPLLLGAVVFTALFYRFLYTPKYRKGGAIVFCIICGICITNFAFLKLNRLFASKDISLVTVAIEEHVNYRGLGKDLIFKENAVQPGMKYSQVHLTVSKGLFGYYVIQKKKLVK
jgi:heme/copper-type cytochrome/quinol oxidase subunit 4